MASSRGHQERQAKTRRGGPLKQALAVFIVGALIGVVLSSLEPRLPTGQEPAKQLALAPAGGGDQTREEAAPQEPAPLNEDSPSPPTSPTQIAAPPEPSTEDNASQEKAAQDKSSLKGETASEAKASKGQRASTGEPSKGASADPSSFPKRFTAEEITAGLAPLLSYKVSEAEAEAVKDVLEAVRKNKEAEAKAALAKIKEPAARKLAAWALLRLPSANLEDMRAFRTANPLFPAQHLDLRIESRLLLAGVPHRQVLEYFSGRKPKTGAGRLSLGLALYETGERRAGLTLIKEAWRSADLAADVSAYFTSRHGSLLAEEDRARRGAFLAFKRRQGELRKEAVSVKLNKLKAKKAKSTKGRHRKKKARRHRRSQVEPQVQEKMAREGPFSLAPLTQPAALTLKRRKGLRHPPPKTAKAKKEPPKTAQQKAAERATKLSAEVAKEPAAVMMRLKALQRQGKNRKVWVLLRSLNPNAAGFAGNEAFWDFKRNEIRRALSLGHPKLAYALASDHGPLDEEALGEAEFLAGFIALRYLHEPDRASRHFAAELAAQNGVREEARAHYWRGRALLSAGSKAEARRSFEQAARHFFTYYGQLARHALSPEPPCEFREPPAPSKADMEAMVTEDVFKAVMILKQIDNSSLLVTFFLDLSRQIDDPRQMTLTLELAERVAPAHVAVRAAKIALNRGFATEAYAFPMLFPKINHAKVIDAALLSSLTRQESEFHSGSVSGAGAKGLMQLMPQTAKLVAAANKMKYEQARLVSDPVYNATLGTAYLADLLGKYNGSYVLALAGYNAGPGRVMTWIKQLGDPRNGKTDPIDWVERIWITETRDYVQRVIEGTQIYRCRFTAGKSTMQAATDLHRGRAGKWSKAVQLFDAP